MDEKWDELTDDEKEDTAHELEGRRVLIYQQPLTRENPEGMARLVRRVIKAEYAGDLECWEVAFGDGSGIVSRWILP